MARGGNPRIRITADASGVQKGTREAEGHLNKFARSGEKSFGRLSQAAKIGGASIVGGLGLVARAGVKTAVDIGESTSKNQVLFGRYSKSIDEFAKSTATSFGVSRAAALEATGTFGNLFVALDIAPKKSAEMSTALVKLAADMASFNNASPEEALDAIRSGLVGETEPLRRFGVNLNDAALRTEALRMGLVKTTKEALTPQQKALAVNALLFKQTEKAQGDFHRTSGSLANQQKILNAQFSDSAAALGEKLLPAATKVVSGLSKFVGQMRDGTGAGGEFADKVGQVAEAGEDVAKFLKDHPRLVGLAVAAWATYKTASVLAMAAVKVSTFRKAFGVGKKAAVTEGAIAGRAYATAFSASSATAIPAGVAGNKGKITGRLAPTFKGIGVSLGVIMGAEIVGEISKSLGGLSLEDALSKGPGIVGQVGDILIDGAGNVVFGPGKKKDSPASTIDPFKKPTIGGLPKRPKARSNKPRVRTRGKPGAGKSSISRRVSGVTASASGGAPAAAQAVMNAVGGLSFSSGYRTPEHNAAVGGVANSWHTRGSASRPGAVDLVGSGAAMQAGLAWARANIPGLAEAMIHDVGSGLHLHLAGPGILNFGSVGVLAPTTTVTTSGTSATSSTRSPSVSRAASRGRGVESSLNKAASRAVARQRSGDARRFKNQPTREDLFSANVGIADLAVTEAGLTTGIDDDLAALFALSVVKSGRISEIRNALKTAKNPQTITRLTGELTGLLGDIKTIDDTVAELRKPPEGGITDFTDLHETLQEEANRLQEEANQLQRDLIAQQKDVQDELARNRQFAERWATTDKSVLEEALMAAVSGRLGGRVGLGFETPSFAGGVARI